MAYWTYSTTFAVPDSESVNVVEEHAEVDGWGNVSISKLLR